MILRKAIRNTYISGHLVHADTYITIVLRTINQTKHLWGPDAELFLPEIWIDWYDAKAPK